MLDDAVNRGVKIDAHVKEEAEKEMERLKAEVHLNNIYREIYNSN